MHTIETINKAFQISTGFVYVHNQDNSGIFGLKINLDELPIDISFLRLITRCP